MTNTVEKMDRELAAAARAKMEAGARPSREEAGALRRIERAQEEDLRREFYQTVPKKHYVEMSGRDGTVLNRQADRYGLPLRGRTVDLYSVLSAFHDLLAKRSKALGGDDEDDKEIDEYKRERTLYTRVMRLEREGVLIERSMVHDIMVRCSRTVRECGDKLEKRFGPEARGLLNSYIDRTDAIIEELNPNREDREG